jgi:ankyrin repeat protein
MAHYVSWAGNSGPAQIESLNQARVLLPAGPRTLHLLAASDRTLVAAKRLIESGESIDQRDNAKMTALAYALAQRDLAAAQRLLRLGARPEAKIGYDDMPAALIPVMRADVAGIRLMQQSGVDYAKLKFQDMTAFEFARQLGDKALVDALDPKARRL